MGVIRILPLHPDERRGFVHVWGNSLDGFEVCHESSSGDSYGSFEQHTEAEAAIAAAHRLNRETYGGMCRITICDAALDAVCGDVGPACLPGDF